MQDGVEVPRDHTPAPAGNGLPVLLRTDSTLPALPAVAEVEPGTRPAGRLEQVAAPAGARLPVEQRLWEGFQAPHDTLLWHPELLQCAPHGHLVTDSYGLIEEANHAAAALLNGQREFVRGKPLGLYVLKEDRSAFYTWLGTLRRAPKSVHQRELRLVPHRVPVRHVILTVAVEPYPGNHEVKLRWLLHDVSAARRIEQALQSEMSFVDSLGDTLQAVFLALDLNGRILRFNSYLCEISGHWRNDLQGRDWTTHLLPERDRPAAREMVRRALAGETSLRMVSGLVTRDRPPRTLAWSARALLPSPEGAAVLVVGNDITELQAAQCQALQAERLAAIGQVMTGLAHESRNALQRSQAALERLRWRLPGQSEALRLLESAQQAQEDLVRLFEDVRAYAAPVRLEPGPCDLAEVWREAWSQALATHPGRAACLHEDIGEVTLGCLADCFRLRQVFRILLDNALDAATDFLEVVIACTEALQAGRPALRVAVRDNGPGLSSEQRQRLFEPFFTTKVKGTGLGLAIAQRIVAAHGGTLTVGNEPGPGAEFVLLLPRSPP